MPASRAACSLLLPQAPKGPEPEVLPPGRGEPELPSAPPDVSGAGCQQSSKNGSSRRSTLEPAPKPAPPRWAPLPQIVPTGFPQEAPPLGPPAEFPGTSAPPEFSPGAPSELPDRGGSEISFPGH